MIEPKEGVNMFTEAGFWKDIRDAEKISGVRPVDQGPVPQYNPTQDIQVVGPQGSCDWISKWMADSFHRQYENKRKRYLTAMMGSPIFIGPSCIGVDYASARDRTVIHWTRPARTRWQSLVIRLKWWWRKK